MDQLIKISNVYYNNALGYAKNNEISEAMYELKKSLIRYSKDIDSLNLIGLCEYLRCNFDKARFYWEASFKIQNKNNIAKYYLDNVKSDKFKDTLVKYNLAINNIKENNYKKAIDELEDILQKNSEFIEPYVIIGLCYYKLKKYQDSKEYMTLALKRDYNNKDYLKYINEINENMINKNLKMPQTRNFKVAVTALVLLVFVSMSLYFKSQYKYVSTLNEVTSYKSQLKDASYKIKEQSKKEEVKNNKKEYANKVMTDQELTKYFETIGESSTFQDGIDLIKENKNKEAYKRFKYLVNKAKEPEIKRESIYFLAVTLEKVENYDRAKDFYINYIQKFKNSNYYDDALYNCGLMLYKVGNIDESKQMLSILEDEVPDSPFLNSKVRYILNKY